MRLTRLLNPFTYVGLVVDRILPPNPHPQPPYIGCQTNLEIDREPLSRDIYRELETTTGG